MGKILATVHSLNVAISKENRLDTVVDEMVSRLRSSSRWKKSHKMRTTLTKWEENLVSYWLTPRHLTCESLDDYLPLASQKSSIFPVPFKNNGGPSR